MRQPRALARQLWVGSVAALVGAALLVLYLQRQDAAEQREQTAVISRLICERTAALLVEWLKHQFEAAVAETIEGIDHSYLREARLPKVAPGLAAGLQRYPYIERFFLWNERFPAAFRDQMLFYDAALSSRPTAIAIVGDKGEPLGGLYSDVELGRELLRVAHSPEFVRRTLILLERQLNGNRFQIVMHTYGASQWPEDMPGIIGFTVNLDRLRDGVLGRMIAGELARISPADVDAPELQISILDEREVVVFGPPVPAEPWGSAPIELAFYPSDLPTRWAGSSLSTPNWRLVVSGVPSTESVATQDYLFAAVLSLILIALGCAAALNRQATQLSQMHTDFVANVTHQLKTPLSLLAAATETLQLERLRTPEKTQEYAALVNRQTARLTSLVERILRLSRIEANAGELELQHLDLGQLVKASVERFDPTFAGSKTSLVFSGPRDALTVLGDPMSLDDAMVNLLENAVKYTNSGGHVSVSVERVEASAIVAIRDDGIGIEAEDLPHIFDKFYRGRRNGSTARGFGVGLSIVHSIVGAHRGRVLVESVPGRGTEFRIVLPLQPAE